MSGGSLLDLAWAGAIAGPPLFVLIGLRMRRRPRWAAALLLPLISLYGLGLWAFLIEPKTLTLNRVTVSSARWQGAPLRIGIISDTHVGAPHTDAKRVERVVARMNAEHPDIVVLLGDYAGSHEPAELRSAPQRSEILRGVAAFSQLKAPLGVWAVLGNHDWWYDGPAIEAALKRANARVFINQAEKLERPGGGFWLAGLADLESKREMTSVPQSLAAVPAEAPVVLLTHYPDPFVEVPSRVALTLAGHTHCGQVDLPVFGRLAAASTMSRRWACGLYNEAGRQLFVTGGVGVSILPVRFRAPPEIVVLTLKAAP